LSQGTPCTCSIKKYMIPDPHSNSYLPIVTVQGRTDSSTYDTAVVTTLGAILGPRALASLEFTADTAELPTVGADVAFTATVTSAAADPDRLVQITELHIGSEDLFATPVSHAYASFT